MVASLVRAVAPDARILPLIAFEPDGSASVSSLVRAIYRAAEEGAKVLNMSFELDRPSAEVRRAIRYATAQGVVCVGSAGNEGSDALVLPAELPEVIGVASTTLDDTLAPFSNYGYRVDLAAPGVDLLTAFPGNRYASASGTSFSAALVSGGVAVLAGKEPGLDHDDAARAVANSVFVSPELGGGRLDLPAALRSLGGGRRSEDAWTR
jgi:subtilisin family serine protease